MCALCFYIYSPLSSSIPNHLVCSRLHYLNSTLCFVEVRFSSLCLSVHLFFFLYFTCASSPFAFCLSLSLSLPNNFWYPRGWNDSETKNENEASFHFADSHLKNVPGFLRVALPGTKKENSQTLAVCTFVFNSALRKCFCCRTKMIMPLPIHGADVKQTIE